MIIIFCLLLCWRHPYMHDCVASTGCFMKSASIVVHYNLAIVIDASLCYYCDYYYLYLLIYFILYILVWIFTVWPFDNDRGSSYYYFCRWVLLRLQQLLHLILLLVYLWISYYYFKSGFVGGWPCRWSFIAQSRCYQDVVACIDGVVELVFWSIFSDLSTIYEYIVSLNFK